VGSSYRLTVNYGLNRVRFPAPVPVGSRLRSRFRVLTVEAVPGGEQLVVEATVEREGGEKPVCVAEAVYRLLD
jgi:acyl dehydratase